MALVVATLPVAAVFLLCSQDRGHVVAPAQAPVASTSRPRIEVPDFRQLDESELSLRARPVKEEADLSDAAFARRHRFPEVLEKRSKRRERERLVHERFKLKHLVERLRGEANSAAQFAPTGRSRENDQRRQQQLDEAEATLRRLDELLQIPGTVGGRATSSQQLPAPPEERERAQARAQARAGSRRASAVVEAPGVSLKIRLTRDGNGRLSAASSSPPPAQLAARPTRHPRRAQRRSRFEEIDESADEDYAMDVDEAEPDEHDSLFATPLLREQHFRPLVVAGQPVAKARKSARAVWAWGQRLPEAACATARDYDEVGAALATALGRA